jgi:hypothetical protein
MSSVESGVDSKVSGMDPRRYSPAQTDHSEGHGGELLFLMIALPFIVYAGAFVWGWIGAVVGVVAWLMVMMGYDG